MINLPPRSRGDMVKILSGTYTGRYGQLIDDYILIYQPTPYGTMIVHIGRNDVEWEDCGRLSKLPLHREADV